MLPWNEVLYHPLPVNYSSALEEIPVRCIQLSFRLRIPIPETMPFDTVAHLEEIVPYNHGYKEDEYAGNDCEGFVGGAEVLGPAPIAVSVARSAFHRDC